MFEIHRRTLAELQVPTIPIFIQIKIYSAPQNPLFLLPGSRVSQMEQCSPILIRRRNGTFTKQHVF